MDIDLETCIIGFLIGVALYFLVNRVFILEGAKGNRGRGRGGNPSGQSSSQSSGQSSSQSPGQSPNPSQTPPSESLTDDEKKLKQIIEGAATVITIDDMLDEIAMIKGSVYRDIDKKIKQDILS